MEHSGNAVEAVTFDAGGTLISPFPSVGEIYAEAAHAFGHHVDATVLERRFIAAWQSKHAFDYSRGSWRMLVAETFGSSLEANHLPELFDRLYDRFREPNAWRIYPDVLPALTALQARGLKLGVISNWDERLRPLLERLGLGPWFTALTISSEVGSTKPARQIFRSAAGALGVDPARIVHVGDGHEEDWRGSEAAGFRGVWLRRNGELEPGAIRDLGELAPLLGKL